MGLFKKESKGEQIMHLILESRKYCSRLRTEKSTEVDKILHFAEELYPHLEKNLGADPTDNIIRDLNVILEALDKEDLNVALNSAKHLEGWLHQCKKSVSHLP